jgi:hypothetical protein
MFKAIKQFYRNQVLTEEQRNKELSKEKTLETINSILELSYYDADSNTLVINTPTNLIVKTEGNQMFITDGIKIDIAEKIHLNPPHTKSTTVNKEKGSLQIKEVLYSMFKAIK